MQIIHTLWQPSATKAFMNEGAFYLWVETDPVSHKKAYYPYQQDDKTLKQFIEKLCGATSLAAVNIVEIKATLPFFKKPLPSPQIALNNDIELPAKPDFKIQKLYALVLEQPLAFLAQLQFLSLYFEKDTCLARS